MDDENVVGLDAGNKSGKYKVEVIWDNAVYARKSKPGHLLSFYYLISWKRYQEEKNTWEPVLAVQYLKKLISSFYKDHSDKPIVTFLAIDTTSPMARPTAKPTKSLKRKWGQPTGRATKCAKWDNKEEFESVWFSIEPEADKKPKIYLPNKGSVGKPTFW